MIALIVTIAPMVKGILIQSLYEGQRGAGGVGTGEVEEGPTAPCALTGGLEPGLGLGMGCADGGFGSNANIKVNDSNNDNVVIRVEVSYSSLLDWIHSGSGTSKSLLLWKDVFE